MAHTVCMLDKQGYTYALARTHTQTNIRIYYLLLFHGKNDSRTRLSVKLYVDCLSCLVSNNNILVGYI